MDYTVNPIEGLKLADQLHDAVKYIRGTYQEAELPELGEGENIDASLPADPNVKNYSYILLHQAAKNAFDDLGVKKLPTVKSLQAEYAHLLDEKKKAYGEYRRSREEMRDLLTAKANVDRILNMEAEQDAEKEKGHGQR